ncbi:hypothetical protein [Mesorhizobium captivum]|nr:hypothetical protein [Mesorhizobium sp. VK3C]MDX8448282.1 hypothetical protein [Mesorhizobium sp. VK3C]
MVSDPAYISTNYHRQGGAQWDIGGVLGILAGGKLTLGESIEPQR